MYANAEVLVSTEWLADHLQVPDVRVVDATWYLPNDGRIGRDTFNEGHIPGSVFFDIDEIADTDSDLPHMLPSPEKFSSRVRKLGLGDGVRIVVYDANGGLMAACRVWWMFRAFGHEDVAVLDGGLLKWSAEGRPLSNSPTQVQERHFTARFNNLLVRNVDQLIANLDTNKEQVIDVRSPGRFAGVETEPRAGLRSGHMPGAINVPIPMIMDPKDYFTFRSSAEIEKNLYAAGVDPEGALVASCGSGITACVVGFGLYLIGQKEVAIYDGSWTEWGGREDTPVTID